MRPCASVSNTETKAAVRSQRDQVAHVVERYFEVHDSELYLGGLSVSQLAAEFGTPIFIYDQAVILRKIQQLRMTTPAGFSLFYSIKANPTAAILKTFLQEGCGLEVASGGELFQALSAGCPPDRLIFAGPGKTRDELVAALQASIREVHVESLEEARSLSQLAEAREQTATVSLRINPREAAGGAMRMGGCASPFGIDEEDLESVLQQLLPLPHLKLVGIHLFMGTQILNAETLIMQYQRALSIARRVAKRLPNPLQTIDFGGGLGTPYFSNENDLDLERVRRGLSEIAEQMRADPLLAAAEGIIEPGRFLINEAGLYLAKVIRVKESRGKTFAVIDGGMHHHLAASGNLGQTIKRNYPVALVNKLGLLATQTVEIVGPLCTPLDMLARRASLPPVEKGDLFGVFQSGAYARTASPHGFLSHDSPAEVLVVGGKSQLIRRRGQPEDYLRDQFLEVHSESDSM